MRYVFNTRETRRYTFPTHINDLVIDRSESATSEVFVVIVRPGQATHMHQHEDAEQVFHVLSGRGRLEIGEKPERFDMRPGDVVRVPPHTLHRISSAGEQDLRYLAVDCFLSGRPQAEPTWDAHVRVVCREQGWDYAAVAGGEAG